jgi:hypothetical protein
MLIFLNGAFGIGKSMVARHLRAASWERDFGSGDRCVGAPALAGLRTACGVRDGRLPGLPASPRLSVREIRLVSSRYEAATVPMASMNFAFPREFTEGVGMFDAEVRHFCLMAPFDVVRGRLTSRPPTPWMLRQAHECLRGMAM